MDALPFLETCKCAMVDDRLSASHQLKKITSSDVDILLIVICLLSRLLLIYPIRQPITVTCRSFLPSPVARQGCDL